MSKVRYFISDCSLISRRAQLTAMLPKIFGLLGDALSEKTGWNISIRAGGLNAQGQPTYFS